MDELTRQKASPEENEKWLGLNPEIVVTGTKEKPLYHIVYFDTSDKMVHIGFSSYKLDFVFDWLKGYFGQERAIITDREPEVEVTSERRWIPVTERLPEESGTYIVCCDDSGCPMDEGIWYQSEVVVCAECEVYRNSVGWTWYENGTEYDLEGIVTHWMPMPEPPKESE